MELLWHIESDDECRLTEEEREFIGMNYELCYLWSAHEYLKHENIDTIITGSSYGINDIEPSFMKHKVANLSMHNQDLYYDCQQIKKALKENESIKNVVMLFGYYSLFYDLSRSSGKRKCMEIYKPLLNDVHNYEDPTDDGYNRCRWLDLHRNRVLDYFGDIPSYYGKAVEREIINSEIYARGGWYRLGREAREICAHERCVKHNKQFKYLKTYEESVFILTDMFSTLENLGIRIFIVIPPFTLEYRKEIKMEYQQCLINLLNAVPQNINFLDMNEIGFDSVRYFADPDHLNLRGAIETSRIIDDFLYS